MKCVSKREREGEGGSRSTSTSSVFVFSLVFLLQPLDRPSVQLSHLTSLSFKTEKKVKSAESKKKMFDESETSLVRFFPKLEFSNR